MTAHAHHAPAAPAPAEGTPAWRLIATLALGGAVAGALIADVYERTLPTIQGFADARIAGAVHEVLGGPARLDTLYLVGDLLSRTPPPGIELRAATKLFEGFDAEGHRVGVAVEGSTPGFADVVRLLIGFDPATGTLTGYATLEEKETPGLGSKIETDSGFTGQFAGKVAPLTGTKSTTTDPHTVQTITGATISSRTVVEIINTTVARWGPLVQAFDREGTP